MGGPRKRTKKRIFWGTLKTSRAHPDKKEKSSSFILAGKKGKF